MTDCDSQLREALTTLRQEGLYRELKQVDSPQQPRIQIRGEPLLNFSSNDYLGLANHPELKEAAVEAVARYGAGSGASRLICGSLAPHHALEERLAAFKATEAAMAFSTGYAAALGTICAILRPNDIVILDKLVHACIVDAARLSRAKIRVFRHNDLNNLEDLLKWAGQHRQASANAAKPRILVVTESVFSMDGDLAPLHEIVELKETHGAWLMVDEAHATGLYGLHRRGLIEACGMTGRVEIQMGTLGKALGAAGGFITGSRTLIEFLTNKARSFIFSTAPVPAAVAAAAAAVDLVQSEPGEQACRKLWELVSDLPAMIAGLNRKPVSPIVPIQIGDETAAVAQAASLLRRNIYIPAIRYPTVARGRARLRLTLTAAHTPADLEQLATALTADAVRAA
jgi:8-amino-7-oxononanoate synthase